MDVGTVLDGEQAVAEGLIDELGGLAQAVGKLTELIEAKIRNKRGNRLGDPFDYRSVGDHGAKKGS